MKIENRFLVGSVAACAMLAGHSALAQDQGKPPTRQDRPDMRSPGAIAAENYEPIGVPLGSFRLFPQLELDEVYNDNIFASSSSTGKTASFIQLVKPSLDLRSDWTRHMLNLYARGTLGFYSATSAENFQDFSVGADGRVDIQRDWNVYGGGSFSRLHEELGTPNTVTSSFPVSVYNQIVGNVGYYQKFNRLSARLDARLDNYNYLNQGPGPAAGTIFNSDRDRTEFRESARVGYEFIPGYEVFVRGGLNQRRYVNSVDSQGFAHNSSGFDAVAGIAIDFGGITSMEAFAGFVEQDYVDSRFPSIKVPTFGIIGYWSPLRELTVKPFLRRTVEESAITTTSAYLSTSAGVDADYNARPNIKVNGHIDYSIADYNAINGDANRYDQYATFRAGIMYSPTTNFFIGPQYQYIRRWSNQANSDYDQNMIMLRLGARL